MNTDSHNGFVLLFNGSVVGTVDDVFQSEGTWYGRFHRQASVPVSEAVMNYVKGCELWNESLKSGKEVGDLHQQFPEVIGHNLWWVERGGHRNFIENAPVFFAGGDISWSIAE